MCYKKDLKSDFHWRKIEDTETPCIDHTYLVSDGKVIGLCGHTINEEDGKSVWYPINSKHIKTTTYYGADEIDMKGNKISKTTIDIKDIKYWCPIPSLEL